MNRVFLDWSKPFLRQVAVFLIDNHSVKRGEETVLDLSGVTVAIPSRRSRRRLDFLLVEETRKRIDAGKLAADWFPPETITVGQLPELLYPPKKPFADSLTGFLAWRKVFLDRLANDPESLTPLFSDRPDPENFRLGLETAGILATLHREFAAEGIDFSKPVEKSPIFEERRRWKTLRSLQEDYLQTLESANLWDIQTARILAVQKGECRAEKRIYVAGAVDLNDVQRQILRQVASQSTILLNAPEEKRDYFDDCGVLISDRWESEPIRIDDAKIYRTDTPADEGRLTASLVAKTAAERPRKADGKLDASGIAVGVPDSETIPFLAQSLFARSISVNVSQGTPASWNRVVLLLKLLAELAAGRKFDVLAELIRHPDMEAFFLRSDSRLANFDWLSALDRYQNRYIPDRADRLFELARSVDLSSSTEEVEGDDSVAEVALAPTEADPKEAAQSGRGRMEEADAWSLFVVCRLLAGLLDSFQKEPNRNDSATMAEKNQKEPWSFDEVIRSDRTLGQRAGELRLPLGRWPERLAPLLEKIYPPCKVNCPGSQTTENGSNEAVERDRLIDIGLQTVFSVFDEMAAVPDSLAPTFFGDEAVDLLLWSLQGKEIASPRYSDGVDLIGWLDAALDDSPEFFLTGVNDGILPSGRSSDLFLPDKMRKRLGLEDSGRLYARDAYWLSAVLALRPETRLLLSRRSLDEGPLLPSRLLLATDPEEIARRFGRFFGEEKAAAPEMIASPPVMTASLSEEKTRRSRKISQIFPPILRMTGPVPGSLSVSQFAEFLNCPYYYFLGQYLKLTTLGDSAMELGFDSFGNVVHEVLRLFGNDESIGNATDENVIAGFLTSRLDRLAARYRIHSPAGTVQIQLEQARRRLRRFAAWQAAWRAAGNEIRFVETSPPDDRPFLLTVDGQPMRIRGKIDRIDYNPKLDLWFIFDYKTFDSANVGKTKDLPPFLPEESKTAEIINVNLDNEAVTRHGQNSSSPDFDGQKPLAVQPLKKASKKSPPEKIDGEKKTPEPRFRHWRNLQLPLYVPLFKEILASRGLAPGRNPPLPAYIVLTKSDETKAMVGLWRREDLDEANQIAERVVRAIRRLWTAPEGINPNQLIDPQWTEESGVPLRRILDSERLAREEFASIIME